MMPQPPTASARATVTFERRYTADISDLWWLWTTREGFESWWGPVGFHVEVSELVAEPGGRLAYDMIASGAEQIAFMKQAGQPLSHPTQGTFVEVVPMQRIRIRHLIDFLPGVEPYPNDVLVTFEQRGEEAVMTVVVDAHLSEELTKMATMGWTEQLTKVPGVLASRAG